VASILSWLCLAVPAWIIQQIIVRAFYARADTWRPMLLGTIVAAASIPLYLALGQRGGVQGLAMASVLGMSISAVATLLWARWLHGAPALPELAGTAARALLLAAPAALLVRWLAGAPPDSLSAAVAQLALGSGLFAVLSVGGIALLGDEAMRDLLRRITRRWPARA
jgi:putative peptidoglycan lipid II flippase